MKALQSLVLAATIFCAQIAHGEPVEALVVSLKGKLDLIKANGHRVALSEGSKVAVGSRIRTGANSEALLRALPDSALKLLANTTVVLTDLDLQKKGETVVARRALLDLQAGSLMSAIEKTDPKNTDFKVRTPLGVAAARGTTFTVTFNGTTMTVTVGGGKVKVTFKGLDGVEKTIDLVSGEVTVITLTNHGAVSVTRQATPEELAVIVAFLTEAIAEGLVSQVGDGFFSGLYSGGGVPLGFFGIGNGAQGLASPVTQVQNE